MLNPKIKDGYLIVAHHENEVEIRTGTWSGPIIHIVDSVETGALSAVISLLDGTNSIDQVCHMIGEEKRGFIRSLLNDLNSRGIIEDYQPEEESSPARSFFSIFDHHFEDITKAIRQSRICVIGTGILGSKVIANLAALKVGSIRLVDNEKIRKTHIQSNPQLADGKPGEPLGEYLRGYIKKINRDTEVEWIMQPLSSEKNDLADLISSCDLVISCTDRTNPSLWRELNKAALANRQIWTIGTLDGLDGQIGPTFIPFETACYKCLEFRVKSHAPDMHRHVNFIEKLAANNDASYTGPAGLPGFSDVVSGLLTNDVPSLIARKTGFTVGKILLAHFPVLEFQTHRVLKLPRCPECGKTAQGWPTQAPYASLSNILSGIWKNENNGNDIQ